MSALIKSSGYKKLTKEQREFYDAVCLRAISTQYGSPYLRAMITSLYPVSVENAKDVNTFAVDKRGRIYINFRNVMPLGVEWAAGGVIHEAWHVLLTHFDRRTAGFTDNERWSIATDIEINQNLPFTSKEVMRDIHYPKSHDLPDGLLAEKYYELLPVKPEPPKMPGGGKSDDKNKKGKPGQGESGDGQGQPSDGQGQPGQGSAQGQGQPSDGQGQPGQGSGGGQGDESDSQGQGGGGSIPKPGDIDNARGQGQGQSDEVDKSLGNCGSGQDGEPRNYEVGRGDAPQQTPLDQNYIRGEVAREIQKASAKEGQGIGSVPAFAKLWAEEFLAPPKVKWQQLMRSEVARGMRRMKRGSKVTLPNRPARRQPVDDIMFPKRRGYKLKVAIAVDTSGSNLHHLGYAVSEVLGIVRVADVDEVVLFSVDAHANTPKRIRTARDIDFEGGGGTDMRLAFPAFEACGADIGIILTDSQSPWLDAPFEGKAHVIVGGLISSGADRSAFESIPDFLPKVAIEVV